MAAATQNHGLTDPSVTDAMKDQYLTFEIDGEDYGIEIKFVEDIIRMQTITKVPDMPPFVEGITNLRGDLIGVIDVRKRFQKTPKDFDDLNCIIVIEYNEFKLGLIVDSVKETIAIESDNVVQPPNAKLRYYNQFIRNIGKVGQSVRLLLDLDRLLAQE
jgi:purine-binding chemotaxis protein CheW